MFHILIDFPAGAQKIWIQEAEMQPKYNFRNESQVLAKYHFIL